MPIGATSEETEFALGMRHQTVSARYTDLRTWGYITYWRDSAGIKMQRPTTTGSAAYVHISTAKGRRAVQAGLPIRRNGADDPTAGRHGGNPASAAAFSNTNRSNDCLKVLTHIDSLTFVV